MGWYDNGNPKSELRQDDGTNQRGHYQSRVSASRAVATPSEVLADASGPAPGSRSIQADTQSGDGRRCQDQNEGHDRGERGGPECDQQQDETESEDQSTAQATDRVAF